MKTHRMEIRFSRITWKKLLVALCGIVLFAAAIFAANDPWKSKPYQQWTEKDIERILTASPWVRTVAVRSRNSSPDLEGSAGMGMPPDNGQMNPSSRMNPDESPAPEGPQQPVAAASSQNFFVFWQSSKTMRAAVAQRAVLQSKTTEADAEKYVNAPQPDYQIVVQGRDMNVFRTYDEKFAQENSFLRLKKSKEKVSPSRVEFQKSPDGALTAVILYFPKKLPSGSPLILPDEKSIEFTCRLGGFLLDTSFDPQKMKNQAGPDL